MATLASQIPKTPSSVKGTVRFSDPNAAKFFNHVYQKSPGFKLIVDAVLAGGDYKYVFQKEKHSWCDSATRIISIGLDSGDIDRINSDIIFEMCNAYQAAVGRKPDMHRYDSAGDYARAVEMSEWKAVKMHRTLMSQLEAIDSSWSNLNRFDPGFTRQVKPWTDFENYYEEQVQSGHTDRVASHHPNYKKP